MVFQIVSYIFNKLLSQSLSGSTLTLDVSVLEEENLSKTKLVTKRRYSETDVVKKHYDFSKGIVTSQKYVKLQIAIKSKLAIS